MRDDPIVEETRAARRELEAEFGGDLAALWKYFKELEAENADRVVRLEPRPAITVNLKAS
ncbi:MAG TPA: hypothetical protein VLC46_09755 [Thermoanaerobaculia bacterium]|jgi:hypothetical protein|nr:hypothetical protein [Thermoanaerobaculia bacterium]